jgi:hypothetical protein
LSECQLRLYTSKLTLGAELVEEFGDVGHDGALIGDRDVAHIGNLEKTLRVSKTT